MITFDICRVFTHIQSLPSNEELSLKTLSLKTLFLLTAATISRVSSVCRLGPVLRVFEVSFYIEIIYFIAFLKKHFSGSLYFESCSIGEAGTARSCTRLYQG